MTSLSTDSRKGASEWISSAKWLCAVCSVLLSINILLTVLIVDVSPTAMVTSIGVAILFIVCSVGYITERRWVLTYTLGIVLLVFVGAGLYWLQAKQWIGLIPSVLLLVLLLQRGKLESSLKAQQDCPADVGANDNSHTAER